MTDDHICGPRCIFLQENGDGQYVCRLSGMVFGQVYSNGSYDPHHHTDDLPTVVSPSHTPTPRRHRMRALSTLELLPVAIQMIHNLVKTKNRQIHEEKKNASARKNALKHMSAVHAQIERKGGCMIKALESIFACYERGGGGVIRRHFSDERIFLTAQTICHLHTRIYSAYAAVSDHRPTKQAFCVAACYVLADGIGKQLYDPMLNAFLPEQKSLKMFNLRINQIVLAQRFIKEALHHCQQKKLKTG